MTLLRNCFIKSDWPVEKSASQASERVLKKRLALPPLAPSPAISGLTAPQGFVFSVFPVPALGGPGAAFHGFLRGAASGAKSDNGSECYWCGGFDIGFDVTTSSSSECQIQRHIKSKFAGGPVGSDVRKTGRCKGMPTLE
jgi:hypothetical protein